MPTPVSDGLCARFSGLVLTLLLAGPALARGGENLLPDRLWPGADLFTNGAVREIRIEIAAADLEKLRREPRAFVPGSIFEAGIVYSNTAVHLKGSVGSFRPLDDKPALTLDFAKFASRQRYHGLRRIHLNNSVEDPSYCDEVLGSELFRQAGIPAPRVTRAVVFLNGRRLGLYVLKEGFTEDFLSCYFKRPGGNLYEPAESHDVNQHLKRADIDAPAGNRALLKALAQAALAPDPQRRWQRLQQTLELDRFIRFMALEVMICHRDGYCLARNNFRVYQDLDTGKMIFFPHGMDQLFGSAELPWKPKMGGIVARAVLETPEGNRRYAAEFKALFRTLFDPATLARKVDELGGALSAAANQAEQASIRQACNALTDRILARHRSLLQQLSEAQLGPLAFTNGIAPLRGWVPVDPPGDGQINEVPTDDSPSLHIRAVSDTLASWRTKARLNHGRYWFEGLVRVSGVQLLGFGSHQGAGLRIAGQDRQGPDAVTGSGWRLQRQSFAVQTDGTEVEFICEFRAKAGDAWFSLPSLRVVQAP